MPFSPLLSGIAGAWWVVAIRGVVSVLFGLCAFIWPGLTLTMLVLLWGAFAFVDGIAAAFAGAHARWWTLLIVGLVGIAAGVVTVFWPGITTFALLIVIAWWAIARGIFEIAAALRLRNEIAREWLLVIDGIVTLAFGLFVLLFPTAGALSIVWLIGLQALVVGVLMLALSFRLRDLARLGEVRRVM
jgi:uncharacterized membrane protein HdeD (DUF308 family)